MPAQSNDRPLAPAPFAQAWTLEDTQQAVSCPPFPYKASYGEQERWRREVGEPGHRKLAIACGRHMAWLMAQGLAQAPPHAEHARVPFLDALRGLHAAPSDPVAQGCAGAAFADHLDMMLFRMDTEPMPDTVALHGRLQAAMAEGNFPSLLGDLQTCATSGLRLQAQINRWNILVGTRQWPAGEKSWAARSCFVALQPGDIQPPALQHATIPVPSGQLLVADWFSLPAFNDLTRPVDDDEPGHALESTHGRAARTHRYASQLGVAHVFGRSPSVLADSLAVKVGHLPVEGASAPASLVGQIHADLRWTTLVDRQHLETLLARALGPAQAARQVQILVDQTPGLLQVQVPPGTHHLYFSGDGRAFSATVGQAVDASSLGLEAFEEPVFVLTRDPLRPAPAVRRKPQP